MNVEQINHLLFGEQNVLSQVAAGQNFTSVLDKICHDLESIFNIDGLQCAIFERVENQFCLIAAPSKTLKELTHLEHVPLADFGYDLKTLTSTFSTNQRSFVLESQEKQIGAKPYILHSTDSPLFDSQGQLLGLLVLFSSIEIVLNSTQKETLFLYSQIVSTSLQRSHESNLLGLQLDELRRSNEKFRAFIKVMPDLALIIDETGLYEDVHGSPDNLIYVSATEIINHNVNDIFPEADAARVMSVIKRALATNKTQEYEYTIDGENGESIFEGRITPINYNNDEKGLPRHVLWMARDVTADKKIQKRVKQLAYFDPLTQLPNRRMFNERLKLTVDSKSLSEEFGAILFLDLDEFKRINDSLGHSAGDKLLKDVSARLRDTLRKSDILARIGGDEFVVLVENLGKAFEEAQAEISVVAKKIQESFNEKFDIEELAFKVTCSIGICFIDGTTSATNIMKFADTAMYNSKRQGGNSYSYYDAKKQTLLDRQLTFESEIVSALESNQFCAFFQPQINSDGTLSGAEALIRWIHPDKGLIPPNEFISVAEQFGLIQKLQDVVLEDICKLLNQLESDNLLTESFKLSINISHSQFKSSSFKKMLMSTIKQFNVSPSRITLEITESMLSHDIKKTVQLMSEIADSGFSFSIDDFGTGYSNLSNLHAYPVEELKIDKSFVDRMSEHNGLSIVETIINLAQNLGMNVVAEGVETAQQVEMLKERKVDILQGYHFSKPLPFDDYVKWHKEQF